LYSILAHTKSIGISRVLLLSGDEVFDHKDVMRIATDEGIQLTIVHSIEGAIEILDKTLSQARREALEARAARLRSFLLTQRDMILSRIRGGYKSILGTSGFQRSPKSRV